MTPDKTDLVVVRDSRPNSQVARDVVAFLADNPNENTVQEIAAALDVPEEQVITILSNYTPTKNGVEMVGEGKGGGWLPEEIASRYRE